MTTTEPGPHGPAVPNPTEHNQWYPFQDRPLPSEIDGILANPAVVPTSATDPLPASAKFVVVGAGIHGMSTAFHLAKALTESGRGTGADVVLIDKQGPGAGATGLACGCVRNMYMTGPLHAILRASVEVWESDPINFGFQQVGYISVGEKNQVDEYHQIHQSQNDSGFRSDLYVGAEAESFLKGIWPDFKMGSAHVALHELRSGYAGTHMVMWGLDQKCRQWGVTRVYGVEVNGYDTDATGSVTGVQTSEGSIACEQVVVGAGAWTPHHWEWLGGADTTDLTYADGTVVENSPMWTFWRLLEGEVVLPPGVDFRTADQKDAPVLHVELMDTPVYGADGQMIHDHVYTYLRYAAERVGVPGIQGGTIPIKLTTDEDQEPYGHLNDRYQADDWFAEYYTRTLEMLFERFEGIGPWFKQRRNGGIGAFTADNVPIFDHVQDNAYVIADSNHGFKMIGVGKLVADELVHGVTPDELKPFTAARFANGGTFGSTNSNSPWV